MIGRLIRRALREFTERNRQSLSEIIGSSKSATKELKTLAKLVTGIRADVRRLASGPQAEASDSVPSPKESAESVKRLLEYSCKNRPLRLRWSNDKPADDWITFGTATNSDIWHDGCGPVDLPDGVADEIVLDHVLQTVKHPRQTLPLLRECRRLLKTGGVIHVKVPDAAWYLAATADNIEGLCPEPQYLNYTAPIDVVNYALNKGESLFTQENLREALSHAEFGDVARESIANATILHMSASARELDTLTMEERPALLVIAFNRPDTLSKLVSELQRHPPRRLYIAQDGARTGNPQDKVNCAKVRKIIETLRLPCPIQLSLSDTNLGAMYAQKAALDWFFQHEEEGIVLEDDCIPDPTFYRFCRDLLAHYRDDPRIMWISGNNFQRGIRRCVESYYFSRFPHCWGWASWRRVWQSYDLHITEWPHQKEDGLLTRVFRHREEADYWTRIFDLAAANEIRGWDYRMTFHMWASGGLAILPSTNLVRNIGFGTAATHCRHDAFTLSELPTYPARLPLAHPQEFSANDLADEFTSRFVFGIKIDGALDCPRESPPRVGRYPGKTPAPTT